MTDFSTPLLNADQTFPGDLCRSAIFHTISIMISDQNDLLEAESESVWSIFTDGGYMQFCWLSKIS